MQKKTKDRLDFDFPSETARRDKGKERKQNEDGRDGRGSRRGKPGADSYDVDESGREAIQWESNGHLNFFADLEKVRLMNPMVPYLPLGCLRPYAQLSLYDHIC